MKHVIINTGGAAVDAAPSSRLLHKLFEAQAVLRPTHPAVECGDEILTYAELDAQADQVAALLRRKGVGPGSLVALYMSKSCRLFAGLLGVLKAGAGYVPLDTKFPVGRILAILEDAEVKIVLSDERTAMALPSHLDILNLDEPLPFAWGASPAAALTTPNDICYVIYTSGSTGRPKGVVIEHRNAVNFVEALHKVYRLGYVDKPLDARIAN